jgi:hypothetical protein
MTKVRLLREPTKQQQVFINSQTAEQCYGGAKRGGKSVAGGMKLILLSVLFPGNRLGMFRKEFTDLLDTTLKEFWMTCPPELLDRTYGNGTGHNKGERTIRLKTIDPNVPSEIIYRGLGDETDFEKAKSLTLGGFFIDEPTEIPFKVYQQLRAQLTWMLPNRTRPPYMAMLGTNPEPGWVKERFVDQKLPGCEFIPALPRDNPHLPPGWEGELRASYDQEWVDKYLDGSWEVTEGMVFTELDARVHDIGPLIDPKSEAFRPEYLKRFREVMQLCKMVGSIDPAETGFIAHTVNAITPWDDQIVLQEYYEQDKLVSEACQMINQSSQAWVPKPKQGQEERSWKAHFQYTLIDPSATQRSLQSGNKKQAVADAYRAGGAGDNPNPEFGIPVIPAWNALQLGLEHLKQRLHINPHHHHPITGQLSAPHFYIIRKFCRDTWKDMKEYRKRVTPLGKVVYLGRDHGLDTVRYVANAQVRPPEIPEDLSRFNSQERFALASHRKWAKSFGAPVEGSNSWY